MPGTKRDFYNVCPSCWTVRVKRRVFKSPRYLCEVCGKTFSQKKRISHDERLLFHSIVSSLKDNPSMMNISKMGISRFVVNQVEGNNA